MSGQGWQVDGPDRVAAFWYTVGAGLFTAVAAVASRPELTGPWRWWWPVLVAVLFAGLSTITPMRRDSPPAAATRAVCWVAAGGWVAWGAAHGIIEPRYWLVLLVGTAVLGVAATLTAMPTDLGLPAHIQPSTARLAAASPAAPVGEETWGERIARISKGKVAEPEVHRIEKWDTGTGYSVVGSTVDGTTWDGLKPYEGALAASLRLPEGGGVTVLPGGDAAGFRVDVLEQDVLREAPAYPGLDAEGGPGDV